MIHRAICGSMERFLGILIEHFAGHFPLWLAPVQVVVATITSEADDYASEVVRRCAAAGLRVEADLRNEKINYKVREHSLAKVPVLLVVGARRRRSARSRSAASDRRTNSRCRSTRPAGAGRGSGSARPEARRPDRARRAGGPPDPRQPSWGRSGVTLHAK